MVAVVVAHTVHTDRTDLGHAGRIDRIDCTDHTVAAEEYTDCIALEVLAGAVFDRVAVGAEGTDHVLEVDPALQVVLEEATGVVAPRKNVAAVVVVAAAVLAVAVVAGVETELADLVVAVEFHG